MMKASSFEQVTRYLAGARIDHRLHDVVPAYLPDSSGYLPLPESENVCRVSSLVFGSTSPGSIREVRFAALLAIHRGESDVSPSWYCRLVAGTHDENLRVTGFGSGMITEVPATASESAYFTTIDHIHADLRMTWSDDPSFISTLGGLPLIEAFDPIDVRK